MTNEITNGFSNGANLGIIENGATLGGLVSGLNNGIQGEALTRGSYGLNQHGVYVMPQAGTVVELSGEALTFSDYRDGQMVWIDADGEETYTL